MSEPDSTPEAAPSKPLGDEPFLRVRRIHRRDLNRTWEFLKLVFREVNRETVEYQRPRSKKRFLEVYEEEGVEQLLFEVHEGHKQEIVGYAECAFEITGTDNWMNERYFAKHDMRPLFVEELAVHPGFQGRGIGSFLLEQLEHLARLRGCTHLVLEVAENNENALNFYKARSFFRLDAAIFLAKKVIVQDELLPPRRLKKNAPLSGEGGKEVTRARKSEAPPKKGAAKKAAAASAKKAAASAPAKKAAAPAKKAGGKRTMVKAVSAPLAAMGEASETKS
jgi:ribosomal protein S18 acetylase RimI-like enzyme